MSARQANKSQGDAMNIDLDGVSLDLSFLPEDVQQAAADAVTSVWGVATTGLKNKNGNLIQQLKDAKEQARQAGDGNTAEVAIRLSETQEQLNSAQNDLRIAQHNAEQANRKLEDATSETGQWKSQHNDLVKSTALTEQLTKVGVSDPNLIAAARALLMPDVSLGDDGAAMMGDKPLHEALGEWHSGDVGKSFVSDSGNAGGNARGGNAGNGHSGPNPWAKDSYNVSEQSRITLENADLATQLQSSAGV